MCCISLSFPFPASSYSLCSFQFHFGCAYSRVVVDSRCDVLSERMEMKRRNNWGWIMSACMWKWNFFVRWINSLVFFSWTLFESLEIKSFKKSPIPLPWIIIIYSSLAFSPHIMEYNKMPSIFCHNLRLSAPKSKQQQQNTEHIWGDGSVLWHHNIVNCFCSSDIWHNSHLK